MFYCDAISHRPWDGRSMLIQGDPMAQIATTKGHRPADAARDLAAKGQGTTLRLVPKTAASTATKHLAGGSAAAEMIRGSSALAHFWLEQASKQMACTAQTLRKLAAARRASSGAGLP